MDKKDICVTLQFILGELALNWKIGIICCQLAALYVIEVHCSYANNAN